MAYTLIRWRAPDDLAPALVGALLKKGRISDAQIEATILDFARRGMLVMEPVSKSVVQMRLLGDGKDLTGYEKTISEWTGRGGPTMNSTHSPMMTLPRYVRGGVSQRPSCSVTSVERGWYDPAAASARRRPLYIAGAIGVVAAAVALVLIARLAGGLGR